MDKTIIAHVRKQDQESQTLQTHLEETSNHAKQFAAKIGLDPAGELIGYFHDLGKASSEFQNYLKSAAGLIHRGNEGYVNSEALKGKIDHSSAGAQLIFNDFLKGFPERKICCEILALCILSHHSGLVDCLKPDGKDDFSRRISKKEEDTHLQQALSNLGDEDKKKVGLLLSSHETADRLMTKLKGIKSEKDTKDTYLFKIGLLVRYLFSCLLDADRLSTANFEKPDDFIKRSSLTQKPWGLLIERFQKKQEDFESRKFENPINEIRASISQDCENSATQPMGVFQLKVPTGGGKTFASLRFALNHARKYDLDHIFYIIPYTSIIDQNADAARTVLETTDDKGNYEGNIILEHHSNLTPEEETDEQALLSENWDAPIIFTTQVQFLETLFGSGTRSARRMHQLSRSVIIFDEVQTLPLNCVHMFNTAVNFLVHDCGSSVVLCTATQPLLDQVKPEERALVLTQGSNLIKDEENLYQELKRVDVQDGRKIEKWGEDDVVALVQTELEENGSVLVVVNTKKSARNLYQRMKEQGLPHIFHLSTNMCPAHRLETIKGIIDRINQKKPVICVSTQLIEAGIDIDFGCVVRYLAGLDSIAQAAGRCNRNGTRKTGIVWVVNPKDENLEKLKEIQVGAQITERIFDEFNQTPEKFTHDRIGLKAIEEYYQYYFFLRSDEMRYKVGLNSAIGRDDDLFNLLAMNTKSIENHISKNQKRPDIPLWQSFHSAADEFHAIDSITHGVVVQLNEDVKQMILDLSGSKGIYLKKNLLKKLQRYSVNLYPHEFKKMLEKQAIKEVSNGIGIYYLEKEYYSDEFGWQENGENSEDTLFG